MEDMDLLSGSNTHLSKLSSDGNMAAAGATAAMPTAAQVTASASAVATAASAPVSKLAGPSNGPSIFPGIKYRNIGKTGLKCSNIGLGSIKVFNHENPEVSEEIITLAYESGINLFDISDPYMADESERQLGRVLKKKGWSRRSYSISTKIYWHKYDILINQAYYLRTVFFKF